MIERSKLPIKPEEVQWSQLIEYTTGDPASTETRDYLISRISTAHDISEEEAETVIDLAIEDGILAQPKSENPKYLEVAQDGTESEGDVAQQ